MPLLEREAEIAAVDEAFARARDGAGAVLIVEGPAGIGKTAIVEEARRRAESSGARVALARGGTLEREIAHGVVRQILEPPVRAATPKHRAALLAGAAMLAGPVVLSEGSTLDLPDGAATNNSASVAHGLYWLTANLAAEAPLVLAVDDAQWSDVASLRFLLYLARRLEGLPIVVLITIRTGEATEQSEVLTELSVSPSSQVLRPEPLSERAVLEMARTSLVGTPESEFVTACRQATGGVPFLLNELFATLAGAGVLPSAASATAVTRVTSKTVSHATLLRLSRLAPAATIVARCSAVLGRNAEPDRVALVGGLDTEKVLVAYDALVGAHILSAGQPMTFVHPIVRASIYEEMPAGARSVAHAAAARLLAAEGADPEEVAAHLLATEPGSIHDAVPVLREAAAAALLRGAPENAVAHLRRALLEVRAAGIRATVLHELGRAEALVRDPLSLHRLEEALRLTTEPQARAGIVRDLVDTLAFVLMRPDDAFAAAERALDALGDTDVEARTHLETFRAGVMFNDPLLVDAFDAERDRFEALASREGRAARLMAAMLASCAVCRAEPAGKVAALAERGLDGGRLMAAPDADTYGLQVGGALAYIGDLDRALAAADAMRDAARRRGSAIGFARASAVRSLVLSQRGDLRAVEADVRAAFDLARQDNLAFSSPSLLRWSIDALVERPQLDDIAALVETLDIGGPLAESFLGAWLLESRGRLRLTHGRRESAAADLRRCGEVMTALRIVNPIVSGWRSSLALALPAGERAEAQRLAAEELELSQRTGLPRSRGIAMRTMGLLDRGDAGISLLREAASVLDSAGAPLEVARTLVDLGAALRRANQRAAAREPLRTGLDLADSCGAERLAARAEEELRATGGKPRRRAVSGLDALTPSELRVARHAATGIGNREIAQALFVTTKTVENQLSVVYQKLGIRGRAELVALMGAAASTG